jgi:hypothetical protein
MKSIFQAGQSQHPQQHAPTQPTHVVKRIAPTQPGAIKLARQFGDRLVCVRYRHDRADTYRYTTVELIVDAGPIQTSSRRGTPKIQLVAIRVDPSEIALNRLVRSHGAVWDGKARLWYLRRATAKALGLLERIV